MRIDTLEYMTWTLDDLQRLREERGATDPILIIAGIAITLILLVGGSFAVSGFIGNAHNLNAKGDLDRVATAQAAMLAERDRYGTLRVGPTITSVQGVIDTDLLSSSIGFTPTDGNNLIVTTSATGWAAVTMSASGEMFIRTSASSATIGTYDRTTIPAGVVLTGTGITSNWVIAAMARVSGF